MNKILLFLFLLASGASSGQSRLMLNGGIMTMNNSVYLVVDNPAANAITRTSGHIISENQNNLIKWNIANTTGTYTVPWGYGASSYLPVTFTKAAGTGAGNFLFSTYHTGWQNSASLPAGITSFNGTAGDNSAYVVDRFWQVNAQGYSAKPALTNLVMTYLTPEYTVASNTIAETGLKAQRWNSSSNTWYDYGATGTVNTAAKTVTIATVSPADLYPWWVLVDQASTLPLNFLSFEVHKQQDYVQIRWSAASEMNVSRFEVQRSSDGQHFETIRTVTATGGNGIKNYSAKDDAQISGLIFYRIREVDNDGSFTYSVVRNVTINQNSFVSVYPNPSTDYQVHISLNKLPDEQYTISVHDVSGALIYLVHSRAGQRIITLDLTGKVKKGMYILKISGEKLSAEQKIFML